VNMAKKLHWTQRSQARRRVGTAIRDDVDSTTWMRGYAGDDVNRLNEDGFKFLGFTDPETKIRRGIFNAEEKHREELERLGYRRVKFNASIRERDVKRDYKFKKHTTKQGFFMNRPVYRLKK
jgi:hypothetical protein